MRFFDHHNVVAFTSDRSMDFQPSDFDAPLSPLQREYLKKECGIDTPFVYWRKQIHGDTILVAEDSPVSCHGCPDADAYITNQRNLPIAIRTADCVPVFLFDPVKNTAGLAHAGWKGTFQRIAFKTVKRMEEVFGSQPKDIQAVLGPSIQSCCYQVGDEFRQYFPKDVIERDGKLFADVSGNNYNQLVEAGVAKEHITLSHLCTCCDPRYHSFRRDGVNSGRMISLMQIL